MISESRAMRQVMSQMKDYLSKLEDRLRTIPAVSKLKKIGEQKEQISVTFSSEKMAQYNVNLFRWSKYCSHKM